MAPPKPKSHLPELDAIRGFAILSVFLFHVLGVAFHYDHLPWNGVFRDFSGDWKFLLFYPLTYGSAGVAVFFVVSGFCIHLSYARSSDQRWSTFAIRRFFRIYPPYVLALLLFLFVWPWSTYADLSTRQVCFQLLTHLFSVHNLDSRSFFAINPSFWSIAVEVQLYAIYPLLIWCTARLGWRWALVIAACFELGIRSYASYYLFFFDVTVPPWITKSPFAFWLSWSIGAHVADCFLNNKATLLAKLDLRLVSCAAFMLPVFKLTSNFAFLAFAALTAGIIGRLVFCELQVQRGPVYRHLCSLGIVSYSFYLIHQPVLMLFPRVLNRLFPDVFVQPAFAFLLLLFFYPPLYFLACATYRFVELPSVASGKAVENVRKRVDCAIVAKNS